MKQLLIATHNPGKAREFADMLGGSALGDLEVVSLAHFPEAVEVEETGHTFRANACLKAGAYARLTKLWTIADDSGLEVDALGGNPGVYSARWAARNNAGGGDADNNQLLLMQLAELPSPRRGGRFVCVLALADPMGRVVMTVRQTLEGRIAMRPRGAGGFGYDPLFEVRDLQQTTAELSPQQKGAISHRGKALRELTTMMTAANIAASIGGGVGGGWASNRQSA